MFTLELHQPIWLEAVNQLIASMCVNDFRKNAVLLKIFFLDRYSVSYCIFGFIYRIEESVHFRVQLFH